MGAVAQLVGAVEIPLTPDVIIDVWRGPDQLCWATTSVNGVSFAGNVHTYTAFIHVTKALLHVEVV